MSEKYGNGVMVPGPELKRMQDELERLKAENEELKLKRLMLRCPNCGDEYFVSEAGAELADRVAALRALAEKRKELLARAVVEIEKLIELDGLFEIFGRETKGSWLYESKQALEETGE